jgi:hypothetical protein
MRLFPMRSSAGPLLRSIPAVLGMLCMRASAGVAACCSNSSSGGAEV